MSEQDPSQEVTLLFYRQVVALDAQRHGDYKLGMTPNQSFASHTNSIPLTGIEFVESCKEYPIVFTRANDGSFNAVAVLGYENGENLFLDGERRWNGSYVPAFVRRYPFVLGDNPDDPDQPRVCIDESCAWLGRDEGEPLFVKGQPSVFLRQILDFMADYNSQGQRTAAFCRQLADWGLLKENQVQATTDDGKQYTLSGIWVIDEPALLQLDADKLQSCFKTGELGWMYFHLASLSNFRSLMARKSASVQSKSTA